MNIRNPKGKKINKKVNRENLTDINEDKRLENIIGYSLPSLLKVVTFLPPYRVSKVLPIFSVDTPKSFALFLLVTSFTSGLFFV